MCYIVYLVGARSAPCSTRLSWWITWKSCAVFRARVLKYPDAHKRCTNAVCRIHSLVSLSLTGGKRGQMRAMIELRGACVNAMPFAQCTAGRTGGGLYGVEFGLHSLAFRIVCTHNTFFCESAYAVTSNLIEIQDKR